MQKLTTYIIKDDQLNSFNDYLNARIITIDDLLKIKYANIVISYSFYNNIQKKRIHSSNTIIVTADNDSILLTDNIPNNVFQIVDGVPLYTTENYFNVDSEFMSELNCINKALNINKTTRTKTFFTLNGRNNKHRSALINALYQYNLIKQGLVIYHNPNELSHNIITQLGKMDKSDPFIKNFKNPEQNTIRHDAYAIDAYYENYNLEIVTETTVNAHFITEKTIKPLSASMPFLVVSSPGYLKHFQSKGFKTFSDIWDESYDNITDTHKRINAIVKLLNNLIKTKEIYTLTEQCIDILKHNAQHVNTIAQNHTKTKVVQVPQQKEAV